MALNYLAGTMGLTYDRGGETARGGEVINSLLARLETLEYYRVPAPKTLGKEWFEQRFLPYLEPFMQQPLANLMRTVTEHIALRLAAAILQSGTEPHKVLVTGGGANNQFLLEQLKEKIGSVEIVSVDKKMTDFKEAIIFALLGYLRVKGIPNTLATVTGASSDSCGGSLIGFLDL